MAKCTLGATDSRHVAEQTHFLPHYARHKRSILASGWRDAERAVHNFFYCIVIACSLGNAPISLREQITTTTCNTTLLLCIQGNTNFMNILNLKTEEVGLILSG
jgi:hypothetical protein